MKEIYLRRNLSRLRRYMKHDIEYLLRPEDLTVLRGMIGSSFSDLNKINNKITSILMEHFFTRALGNDHQQGSHKELQS